MAAKKPVSYSIVKFATVGSGTKEVAFEGAKMSLVAAAQQAELSLNDLQVKVNKTAVKSEDFETKMVKDGDVVYLIPQIEGGK